MKGKREDHPLIFVFYVNIGHLGRSDVSEYMRRISDMLESHCEERGMNASHFIIPIRDGESRLECINPVLLSESEYAKTRDIIENMRLSVSEFLSKPI